MDTDGLIRQAATPEFAVHFAQLLCLNKFIDSIKVQCVSEHYRGDNLPSY